MASVFHLCCEAYNIKQIIVKKYEDGAASNKKLYFSAVAIQKAWRGYICREKIKSMNKKANLIQKFIRGWLVRIHLPENLKEYYSNLSVAHYIKQATKIQAFWRGYCVRKRAISIKCIVADREERELVSAEMQAQIKEAFGDLHETVWNEPKQYMEKILKILFDRHHLLRTETKEGLFSIHDSNKLSSIEKILKSFRLTEYMKELREMQQANNAPDQKEIERKKFDLTTTLKSKPYERMLLTQD